MVNVCEANIIKGASQNALSSVGDGDFQNLIGIGQSAKPLTYVIRVKGKQNILKDNQGKEHQDW